MCVWDIGFWGSICTYYNTIQNPYNNASTTTEGYCFYDYSIFSYCLNALLYTPISMPYQLKVYGVVNSSADLFSLRFWSLCSLNRPRHSQLVGSSRLCVGVRMSWIPSMRGKAGGWFPLRSVDCHVERIVASEVELLQAMKATPFSLWSSSFKQYLVSTLSTVTSWKRKVTRVTWCGFRSVNHQLLLTNVNWCRT